MTKNIKAPFNFVPISNQVYIPSWGDKVSQDIPLKDSLSGKIKLKITAQTPIFVSSGRDSDNTLSEFTNYIDGNGKKHYYVPGTSIKGMIRNVLEIMSFGKMNNIQDDRYAIRDIKNDKVYTIIKEQENIKCGWLYKNNGKIYIENCGTPKRVGHDELDRYYSTRFVDNFKIGGRSTERNNNKTIKTDARWAKYKYENLFKGNNFECIYENAPIKNLEQRVLLNNDTDNKGIIVFTGQVSVRDTSNPDDICGKFYEFIFPLSNSSIEIEVTEEKWDEFLFQYFDKDQKKISEDWKYWKEKLNRGKKIPVFFRLENKSNTLKDFGLSYLYKMPYENKVKDILPEIHKNKERDLAELMFGYTDKESSLKGRVQFGHAILNNKEEVLEKTTLVLSSPKASYYPIYIKQEGKGGKTPNYNTLMDSNSSLAGWKRYPVHNSVVKETEKPKDSISTKFKPLGKGSIFECEVYFHNLNKIEYGALLSAITLHNNENCFHTLGQAKPYGYGRVKIDIVSTTVEGTNESYLKEFEQEISLKLFNSNEWSRSPQIKELLAMSRLSENEEDLAYMSLKQFRDAKKAKEYLENYSIISNQTNISSKSFVSEEDIKEQVIEEENRLKKEQSLEKQKKAEDELNMIKQETEEKNKKLELESQKRAEEARRKQEIEEQEKQAKAQAESEQKAQKKQEALANGIDYSKGKDFKILRNIIDNWIKLTESKYIPKEDEEILFKTLERLYTESSKRDKKDWEKEYEKSPCWRSIKGWVGDSKAKEWNKKING